MAIKHSGEIINGIVASYLETFHENQNPDLEELRSYAEEHHVPVILKDTESFLQMVLRMKRPSRILEIGTAIGYSACVFADACGCDVVTLEADQDMYEAALVNIRALGFEDKIRVICGDARHTLEDLTGEDPFDLVFIDASKSHYREFWDRILPLCKKKGMIICDNVLMKGMTASDSFDERGRYKTSIRRMREFLDYINHLDYAETTVLPIGDGVSVSILDLT